MQFCCLDSGLVLDERLKRVKPLTAMLGQAQHDKEGEANVIADRLM
jgi:hypothetical protein